MPPMKSSLFFRPQALEAAGRRPAGLRGRARRRLIAWGGVIAIALIAGALALYLSHPERWQRPSPSKTSHGSSLQTKAYPRAPGVTDVEVQRGKQKQVLRVRQTPQGVAVEDVTPQPQRKKSWWQRLWGR